jgi:polyisoprenoid-binding protein YceI
MNRLGIRVAMAVVLFPLSVATLQAAPVSYDIDPNHTAATFKVRHFFSEVPGRFKEVSGEILFDAETPENSSTEILIRAGSVDTNNEKRDNHLRSADFFDVAKDSTITFKSTRISKTDQKNLYKASGDLTMHGVTKPVILEVEVLGSGPDGMGGERAGFVARTTINRKDFNILWNKALDNGGTMLGDDVKIEVSIEAVRKAAS